MKRKMGRRGLIRELAARSGATTAQVSSVLDELVDVVYREAPTGFTLPGLCTFRVVARRARRCRNPRTGELLAIGPHAALVLRPSRRAREAITPRPPGLVQPLEPPAGADRGSAPPAEAITFIPLTCSRCRQEIEASSDLAGTTAECPSCGNRLSIPPAGTPPRVLDPAWGPGGMSDAPDHRSVNKRTIRIELPDDMRNTA